jgi:hypothetical protein
MIRHIVFLGVIAIFVPSLSSSSDQLDSSVYQFPGPAGTTLYTNQKRPGCEEMSLPELTIAPHRGAAIQSSNATLYGSRPFPSDWFDYAGSVGSFRNRLTEGGLYGMQDWLDYDAPIGSMRNSPAYWPNPYGLYRW